MVTGEIMIFQQQVLVNYNILRSLFACGFTIVLLIFYVLVWCDICVRNTKVYIFSLDNSVIRTRTSTIGSSSLHHLATMDMLLRSSKR